MDQINIAEKLKKLGLKKTENAAGMRRKRKINNPIKSTRLSLEEKKFNILIDRINGNLESVNMEYKDLVNSYVIDWVNDLVYNFKKKDFKDKTINLEKLKDEEIFKYSFVEGGIRNKLVKNYSLKKKKFSEKGLQYISNQIQNLGKNIERGDYIPKEREKDEIENIEIYYKKLELEPGEIPTKDQLKKQFLRLSSKYHPDRHPDETEKYTKLFQDLNEAYKIILKYHYGTQNDHLYKN